ncbi:hypothetical protein [Streptomyces sp. NPDC013455]|uniref:hypothetical protein n=1 Tax=Streptomyces sp. NPDC013455 TaxID=3155605 RepID=UPI0033DC2BEC
MQTFGIRTPSPDGGPADTERARPGPARSLTPLLAGAATAVAATGAVLALLDAGTPLRAPSTFLFLLLAPAAAIAAALRGLDPFGRVLTALSGAVVVNMLVAQGMLAVHRWSARGGVVAVTVLSVLVLLSTLLRERIPGKHPQT